MHGVQAWASDVAKEKRATLPGPPKWILERIADADAGCMAEAYRTTKKQERGAKVQAARDGIMAKLRDEFESQEVPQEHVRTLHRITSKPALLIHHCDIALLVIWSVS